jgi:hypothetical protein
LISGWWTGSSTNLRRTKASTSGKGNEMALQRLRTRRARQDRAFDDDGMEINLPFITADTSGPKHLVKHPREARRDD